MGGTEKGDPDDSCTGAPDTCALGLKVATPRQLGAFDLWKAGGPGRLLSRLAREEAGGEVTLTPDELARLLEEFRDEPLPESLRVAIARQLRGQRVRRQGAPRKRQVSLELVEYIMLPGAYAEALKDAEIERARLRDAGMKRGRYDDPRKLPTASSIAIASVKKRLPTLKGLSDRGILNLVSKVKKLLADANDDDTTPPLSNV